MGALANFEINDRSNFKLSRALLDRLLFNFSKSFEQRLAVKVIIKVIKYYFTCRIIQ